MPATTDMTEEEFKVWFAENFFDVRKHRPQKGQVLARYRATAHFVDAWVKRNVIDMLMKNEESGAETAVKVLHNMCGAVHDDAVRVALHMTDDLLAGETVDEVAAKEYKMIIEFFFWAKPEDVPEDLHWSRIDLLTPELDKQIQVSYSGALVE